MIRLLASSDIEEYKKVRLFSLKNDPKAFLSSYEQEKEKSDEYFLSRIIFSTIPPVFGYYGYFDKRKLIGYLQFSKSTLTKKQHVAYIYELYVHPEYRRKGVASKLIKNIIKKAENLPDLEMIELYVNSENSAPIDLYKKLGFEQIATIPKAVKEKNNKYQDEFIFSYKL